jgi:RNA polymerase sigma-70 factor (ECF subfamily)
MSFDAPSLFCYRCVSDSKGDLGLLHFFLKISVMFSPRKDQILQNNEKGGELLVYAEMKKEMGTAVLSKEDALELMMGHYGDSILRLVYLLVKDRGMAEDITQEVFLKAYRGWDSFRKECHVKTWLYRIAVNEAKRYLRSWSFRRIFSTLQKEKPHDVPGGQSVEDTIVGQMNTTEIVEKMMDMSPQYKQVLILHYYEDLSSKEMAQVLGISVEAVRTKLYRARERFKKLLEQEGLEWD